MGMNHVRLETERLLLREFQEAEWMDVVRINAPPEARRYLLSGAAGEEEAKIGWGLARHSGDTDMRSKQCES